MIKNFKHKGLKEFYFHGDGSLLNSQFIPRIQRILAILDTIRCAEDFGLPSYGLHRLKGDRKNSWSVKVSGNWRITFSFVDDNAIDVNLEDYH